MDPIQLIENQFRYSGIIMLAEVKPVEMDGGRTVMSGTLQVAQMGDKRTFKPGTEFHKDIQEHKYPKGAAVLVTGRMEDDRYANKQGAVKLVVEGIQLLGKSASAGPITGARGGSADARVIAPV